MVVDPSAAAFSTAVTCFTVHRRRVFSECEPVPKCRRVAKEIMLRQLARAVLHAREDVEISKEAVEAAAGVTSLVLGMATADQLWSLPDGLPLNQCTA